MEKIDENREKEDKNSITHERRIETTAREIINKTDKTKAAVGVLSLNKKLANPKTFQPT